MIPHEHESSLAIHHDEMEVIPAQTTKAKLTTNAYRQKKKKNYRTALSVSILCTTLGDQTCVPRTCKTT